MKARLHMVWLLLVSANAFAATTPPKEDIHFIAEHLAEAAQDARYFAMPWPVGGFANKGWKPLVSIAGARAGVGFAAAEGGLLTLGLSGALNARWALEMVAYYDRFDVSGSYTYNSLSAFSIKGVPLDLPETALFSHPRGEFKHIGLGAIVSHALDDVGAWRWNSLGGLLIEQLTLTNYQFDYQLTGGANAGATGVLDHSGSNTLIYGVAGVQARKALGDRYEMIPGIILGVPFKNGDFSARISGDNFDLSTGSTGAKPHQIGDGFIYMGMSLRDLHTHLEMDLGAILGYEAFEVIAHEGIHSALLVSLTWRV